MYCCSTNNTNNYLGKDEVLHRQYLLHHPFASRMSDFIECFVYLLHKSLVVNFVCHFQQFLVHNTLTESLIIILE